MWTGLAVGVPGRLALLLAIIRIGIDLGIFQHRINPRQQLSLDAGVGNKRLVCVSLPLLLHPVTRDRLFKLGSWLLVRVLIAVLITFLWQRLF